MLEQYVKSTPGFNDWEANCLPASLDKLGEWFDKQVETRMRNEIEIEKMKAGLSWPVNQIKAPDWDLSEKTLSLAIDIGMYISQVLIKTVNGLKWQHTTKGSKNWIDYGQPVLASPGWRVFNPTRLIITFAYALADNTWGSDKLRQIYENEKKNVEEQSIERNIGNP